MNERKGFTLIELLIVIAIIGILSTLAIIALGNTRAKTRDTKRVADISQISKALELYYADYGYYPTLITPGQPLASADGSKVYMATIPNNPSPRNDAGCNDNNYSYGANSNNNEYLLNFCLSSNTGPLAAGMNSATNAGIGADPYLVGWWRFDEGSGTTVTDGSGSANSGTFNGSGNLYTTAKIGPYAGLFNGSDNYVTFTTANNINLGTNNFSVAFWAKTTTLSQMNVISKNNAGWGAGERGFIVFGTGGYIYAAMGDGTNWIHDDFVAAYTTGQYAHIAVVADRGNTTFKAYVNGSPVAVTHSGSNLNLIGSIDVANQLLISINNIFRWNGSLDDIRLYNKALSDGEVKAIYEGSK